MKLCLLCSQFKFYFNDNMLWYCYSNIILRTESIIYVSLACLSLLIELAHVCISKFIVIISYAYTFKTTIWIIPFRYCAFFLSFIDVDVVLRINQIWHSYACADTLSKKNRKGKKEFRTFRIDWNFDSDCVWPPNALTCSVVLVWNENPFE